MAVCSPLSFFTLLSRFKQSCTAALLAGAFLLTSLNVNADALPYFIRPGTMTPAVSLQSGPLGSVNPGAPAGGTLRLGARGFFDNLNPVAVRGSCPQEMSLTMMALGAPIPGHGGIVRAALARSFDYDDKHARLTVKLRKNATFNNGAPLTAGDVVKTLQTLQSPSNPPYAIRLAGLKTVRAAGADTVIMTFDPKTAGDSALAALTTPIFPAAWIEQHDINESYKSAVPGAGPYRVNDKESVLGVRLVLSKVPGWWGEKVELFKGRYAPANVRIDFYRESTVMREAFLTRELDLFHEWSIKDWHFAYDVPAAHDGRLAKQAALTPAAYGMAGIVFNLRRPVFSDRRVREALETMFDFENLNKSLFFDAYVRCNSYMSGTPAEAQTTLSAQEKALLDTLPGIRPQDFYRLNTPFKGPMRDRIRRALTLLNEAGWHMENGRLINRAGQPMEITLMALTPSARRLYGRWGQALSRLGITMHIELVEQTVYINRLRRFDYDMVPAQFRQTDAPGVETALYWSSAEADRVGSMNKTGVKMPAIDRLTQIIASSTDPQARMTAAKVLDRILTNERLMVPGWHTNRARILWWTDRVLPPPDIGEGEGWDFSAWAVKPGAR